MVPMQKPLALIISLYSDMAPLRQQLATLLITSQMTGQLSEVGVPIIKGTIINKYFNLVIVPHIESRRCSARCNGRQELRAAEGGTGDRRE